MASRALLVTALVATALLAAGSGPRVIDDFEDGLDPNWEVKRFQGETDYTVVDEDGNRVLRADSRAAASGLVYRVEIDPGEYPILAWRWKIDHTLEAGDATRKAGDDYAARVYVVFPHWFPPRTRSLNYIWANKLPRGEQVPNPFLSQAMMIAVRSGDADAGEWVEERRDIVADYRRAFGEDPPEIGAVALMTDTDQTGASAVAYYDDLRLEPRAAPPRGQ